MTSRAYVPVRRSGLGVARDSQSIHRATLDPTTRANRVNEEVCCKEDEAVDKLLTVIAGLFLPDLASEPELARPRMLARGFLEEAAGRKKNKKVAGCWKTTQRISYAIPLSSSS